MTEQDRWEEEAGLSPFTVAVQVAALLVAADLADCVGEPDVGQYLRETADAWNDGLDACIYVEGTDLARRVGVDGYYVRIAPPETADAASPAAGFVPIKNRPWPQTDEPAIEMVSPDALALVRFGLRAPDDPQNSQHGESDRRASQGGFALRTGLAAVQRGRIRGARGRQRLRRERRGPRRGRCSRANGPTTRSPRVTSTKARRLLRAFEACANDGGLLPEQVWDAPTFPNASLVRGSRDRRGDAAGLGTRRAPEARPVTARRPRLRHADSDVATLRASSTTRSRHACWRFNHRLQRMDARRTLRLETLVPASCTGAPIEWRHAQDTSSHDTGPRGARRRSPDGRLTDRHHNRLHVLLVRGGQVGAGRLPGGHRLGAACRPAAIVSSHHYEP